MKSRVVITTPLARPCYHLWLAHRRVNQQFNKVIIAISAASKSRVDDMETNLSTEIQSLASNIDSLGDKLEQFGGNGKIFFVFVFLVNYDV